MDKPEDKQPLYNKKLSGPEDDNLAMEHPDSMVKGNETEHMTLKEELELLNELTMELKGNLITVNRSIAAKQDTIDQLAKRKQKLLATDEIQTTSVALDPIIVRKTNVQLGLMDNHFLVRNANEIFPEEIWELILGNLTAPKDLRNCSTSCQLFDKILHPLKPNFLFLGVFPHICSHLDNELILCCRRVCKGWNEGVDRFIESHPALVPDEKACWSPRNPLPTNGLFHVEFANGRNPRGLNFLEKMRHHPRNPFVGRAVSIRIVSPSLVQVVDISSDDEDVGEVNPVPPPAEQPSAVIQIVDISSDDEDVGEVNPVPPPAEQPSAVIQIVDISSDDEDDSESNPVPPTAEERQIQLVWQALLDFLKSFGKHIWYLHFQIFQCLKSYSCLSEASLFRFLTRDIFTFAPNLRRIQISGYIPCPTVDSMAMVRPLPDISKLESLKFGNLLLFWSKDHRERFGATDMIHHSLMGTLIRASCQQLKQLHVDWMLCIYIFKCNLEWPNLTELYIGSGDLDMYGLMRFEDPAGPSKMPRLRKIGLTHDHDNDKHDFRDLMKTIMKLSTRTNLQVLRLFGGICKFQVLDAPNCLFAPSNLRTIEMDHTISGGDYTFLLRFPLLENLVVFFDKAPLIRSQDVMEREIVELEPYMLEGRVYECDIWEYLPRLKVFTVGRDVFTRECYERIMSRKIK